MADTIKFTIRVTPRTKKNHQRIIMLKRRIKGKIVQRPAVIPSEEYKRYEADARSFIPKLDEPINKKVNICAVYYMPTKRRVDLTNLESALMDVLVANGLIADDNCKIVYSTDGSHVEYDKENPRTEIEVKFLE